MKASPHIALILTIGLGLPVLASDSHDHHGDHPPAHPAAQPTEHPAAHPAEPPAKETQDPHAAPASKAKASGGPKIHVVIKGALERLKDGNRRYVEGRLSSPRRGKDHRNLVAQAQLPFAIVVGCADSRVPPEIVFDQGLGDIFVVRVAGNVLDDPSLGSIEYAVEHLGARLIMVLGHERCGAVDAACKGGNPGAHVGSLVEAIRPAVEAARRGKGDNLLADAVKANVQRVVDQLKGSWPILAPEVREDHLSVVGGVYDLETGLVEFLP